MNQLQIPGLSPKGRRKVNTPSAKPKATRSSKRTGGKDEHPTPLWLVAALEDTLGVRFVLDPCCESHNAVVGGPRAPDRPGRALHYDRGHNGLAAEWYEEVLASVGQVEVPEGRVPAVFANPPFSDMYLWSQKASSEATDELPVVMVAPSRVDREWWRQFWMHPFAPGPSKVRRARCVLNVLGRIRYVGADNDAPFCTAIGVFGGDAVLPLREGHWSWDVGAFAQVDLELEGT